MRKYFLIAYVFICCQCFAQSGWIVTQLNPQNDLVDVVFVNAQTGFMVEKWTFTPPGSRILKTTNGGVNWFNNYEPSNSGVADIFFLNSQTGFAAGGRLHKTTNAGINWVLVPGGNLLGSVSEIFFINELTGWSASYATSQSNIYGTTNGGLDWVLQHSSSGFGMRSVWFTSSQNGFAVEYGINNTKIFKTTNGSVWSSQSNNIKGESVFFVNGATGYISGSDTDFYGSILKTTDSGNSWSLAFKGDLFNEILSVHFPSVNTGYAAGGTGIYKTTNAGGNWIYHSLPGIFTVESVFFLNDTLGFACGTRGTFIRTTTGGVISVNQISSEIPKHFSLQQNYPNPFNPSTIIEFSIPQTPLSFGEGLGVGLNIYNSLGQKIATLVNQSLTPGTYSANWDASNYPSGVYFYRLSSGEFSATQKMILIK